MQLLYLSVAFLAGIVLNQMLVIPWWAWAGLGGASSLSVIFNRFLEGRFNGWQRISHFFAFPPALLLVLMCAGAGRYIIATPPVNDSDLAWYNDKGLYSLVGTISSPPDIQGDQIRYRIDFAEITNPNEKDLSASINRITGAALVTMPRWQQWQYGDRLQLIGAPSTPKVFADFSYKDYLARQGIQSVIYFPTGVQKVGEKRGTGFRLWLINFRGKARSSIFASMPQPEAGLLEGILLGLDNDMPPSLKQAYRDTGTAHIIAISGFNMTLIATLLITAMSRMFRRYWGVLAAILIIVIYTLFVNGSSGVVRAAIMASTAAIAHLFGRRQSGINALFLTAALICLVNPLLIGEVSFQLSFMAVLGLVVFGQPLQNGFLKLSEKWLGEEKASRLSTPVSEYFLFTLAAQLTTLPVIAIQFRRLSLVSLLANPMVLPVQPIILEAGMVTTLAGLIHPLIGKFAAMFAWPLLAYTNFVVSALAKIKGAALTVHPLISFWILIIVLVIILVFLLRNFFKKKLGDTVSIWLVVLLAAGGFSAWSIYAHRPDGSLHIHLVDTGGVSELIIQTPAGKTLLCDLPGDPSEVSAALTALLSPWDYRVDAVVLTRPVNETSLSDLAQMIKLKSVITSNAVLRPSVANHPLRVPDNTDLLVLSPNESLEVEPGFTISMIGESTERSAYLFQYRDVSILMPAGVDYAAIRDEHPDAMHQPDVIVLTLDDVSYIPPRLWSELKPEIILWNSVEVSPFVNALDLKEDRNVEVISDGDTLQIKSK